MEFMRERERERERINTRSDILRNLRKTAACRRDDWR